MSISYKYYNNDELYSVKTFDESMSYIQSLNPKIIDNDEFIDIPRLPSRLTHFICNNSCIVNISYEY